MSVTRSNKHWLMVKSANKILLTTYWPPFMCTFSHWKPAELHWMDSTILTINIPFVPCGWRQCCTGQLPSGQKCFSTGEKIINFDCFEMRNEILSSLKNRKSWIQSIRDSRLRSDWTVLYFRSLSEKDTMLNEI